MTDLLSRAVPGVQGLKPYVPGKPVEELERELGISNIIKLASNENPLGCSPAAKLAAEAALGEIERYPDGNGYALRQRLSSHHDIESSRIVLGNGSNDVLELIARCFLAPGRNAVFSEYAFAVYPLASLAAGAELRIAAALGEQSKMPYGHDLDALLAQVDDQTGVVFIANPNNPTGTWLEASTIEAFLTQLPDQVVAVLDEAYFEYMQPKLRPDSRRLL
ncbi:MAG: aminotransferase class I/II-fold pyridoxal phosphate-dependent enzyme, partial [Salinisphaeraceae bacterium]|nr:aminotransferase class I/II-fold pyridoxal phosphate-dependent enzyme [Salinisphaeraceae bacterium]